MWRELEELLASHPARWMIWEDQPLEESVSRLEALGIASLVYRPCANVPQEGDLLTVLGQDLRSIEETLIASEKSASPISMSARR